MLWVDVAGAPGVGKSELCDVIWPPRAIEPHATIWSFPKAWEPFLCVTRDLLRKVEGHPSYSACNSMVMRSFAKMGAVNALKDDRVYIQTGFAQRGLGLAWRLANVEDVRPYFQTMPVSLGVALLSADVETVEARNRARGKDRAFMVKLMVRPLEIAREELIRRRVPVLELDTTNPVADNVATLHAFARNPSLAVCAGAA